MKVEFTLYDGAMGLRGEGKEIDKGTLEEWWAGPGLMKRSVTSKSYTATKIVNKDGQFRTAGIGPMPFVVMELERQMVHPIAGRGEVAGTTLQMMKPEGSGTASDCVMLARPVVNVPQPHIGLFPTYCMPPGKDLLLSSFDFANLAVVRVSMGLFQKHVMPIDVKITVSRIDALSAHLVDLRAMPLTDADFAAPVGMEPVVTAHVSLGERKEQQPFLVSHPEAGTPDGVDAKKLSEPVRVHVVVGTDGTVRAMRLITTSDPKLATAAMGTMIYWLWEPYKVNGKATEWDGTTSLLFSNGLGKGLIGPGNTGIHTR